MRCAMDLMVTATVRAEEIARENAARVAREAQAKIARTIAYCEKLGAELEKMADKGKKPVVSFVCDKRDCRPLVATNREYADHRTSYNPCGDSLDLELMAEWFAPYCFEVAVEDFHYWNYGCGRWSGYKVTIAPKPACIG